MTPTLHEAGNILLCDPTPTSVRMISRITNKSIVAQVSEDDRVDLVQYLEERALGDGPLIQDALPFLTSFERDFIILGFDRQEWDVLYADGNGAPSDDECSPAPEVKLFPVEKGYRCEVLGEDNKVFTLGFIVRLGTKWQFRCNDWNTFITVDQLSTILAKTKQLNIQT